MQKDISNLSKCPISIISILLSALHIVALTCQDRKTTQDVLSRRIDETTRTGSKNHESSDRGINPVCPSSGGYETCGWNPHIRVNTASTVCFDQIYVKLSNV